MTEARSALTMAFAMGRGEEEADAQGDRAPSLHSPAWRSQIRRPPAQPKFIKLRTREYDVERFNYRHSSQIW